MDLLLQNLSVETQELQKVFKKYGVSFEKPIDEKAFVTEVYKTMKFITFNLKNESQI